MSFYTEAGLANIARLIFNARKKRDMSLAKFGKLCGVHRTYLSRLERCEIGQPSNEYLEKIAPYLGLTLDGLIQIGTGERTESGYRTVEDVLPILEPILEDMPVEELSRLRDIFNEKLAAIEALERGIT